jgi:hypothetical protein
MALDDILIRIRTMFDGKGSTEATKSLDTLDQSSRRAAPALDKTAAASTNASKATRVSTEEFTRAARSASVLTGSMEGMGAMAQQIASRFAGIAAALPVIGMLIAAFTAWKAAITAVIAAQKAQAASLRDITATNSEGAVKAMAKAFDELQKSIATAGEEQKRFVDGQQAMAEAQKALTLANIDAAEQAALSKEPDPLKQAVIKARFTEQRAGVTATSDTETEARKADMLDRQRVLAEMAQQSAAEQAAALQSEYSSTSARGAKLAEKQKTAMDNALFRSDKDIPGSTTSAFKEWQPERDRNLKELQDLADQIKSAKDAEAKARLDADSTRTLLDAQLIRVQASRVTAGTTTTAAAAGTTTATTAVQSAAKEAEVQRLAAQKSAAEAQLPQAQAQAAAAQEYLATVPDRIASGTYSQADQAAMLQSLAAAQQQTALLQSFITRIGQEMAKQNEILRTLPSSH